MRRFGIALLALVLPLLPGESPAHAGKWKPGLVVFYGESGRVRGARIERVAPNRRFHHDGEGHYFQTQTFLVATPPGQKQWYSYGIERVRPAASHSQLVASDTKPEFLPSAVKWKDAAGVPRQKHMFQGELAGFLSTLGPAKELVVKVATVGERWHRLRGGDR